MPFDCRTNFFFSGISAAWSAPSFAGRWFRVGHVCKYACTKENPDEDFEVRISLVLVQKGVIVCGIRYQNDLTDKVVLAGIRGKIESNKLIMQTGSLDNEEMPAFPLQYPTPSVMHTKKGHLYDSMGIDDFSGEPFSFAEQMEFMQRDELRDFFGACFKSAD